MFGSCITRDNFNSRFNAEHRRWYEITAQANQSSIIALMSPPVEPEVSTADGLTDYSVRNVTWDLNRAFLGELVEAQPAYLILDFFGDVHFGVRVLADGRIVTDNHWNLHKTAQFRSWLDSSTALSWRADADRYFDLWTEAMDRFAALVADQCPGTTVIVHHGFYTGRVVTGRSGRPQNLRRLVPGLANLNARRTNKFWARLDGHATSTYGWQSIDLRAENYTSVADHPWGPSWVHYTGDYYHRFLAELHAIDLHQRLPLDLADRVAAVAGASRERNLVQARFVRGAVREQDKRIAALEQRSLAGTIRSALRGRR